MSRRRGGSAAGADAALRELRDAADRVAKAGGTPLAVADGQRLLGVIHLKDIVKGGIRERFAELRRMGIRTVMITGDNPLTAAAIAAEAGVDDFLAEATPEAKLALIRSEQAQGKLVAMCGDGTNDAPALAQADVGVAMNTGTMAAREAGNMVDLDSDPTKLIEIVEIGKQLLMTRGALTTFSIANDVAKYFAIIPAMFLAFYPQLQALNVMRLATPQSAILSAIIFNALIIVALIPLALSGVRYRPVGAAALLRRNLLIYGVGGIIAPFVGIKAIDMIVSASGWRRVARRSDHASRNPSGHRPHRWRSPCSPGWPIRWPSPASPRRCFRIRPTAAWSSATEGGRLGVDRPELHRPTYFHAGPSATTDTDPNDATKTMPAPYNAANSAGSNLGADRQGAGGPGAGGRRSADKQRPRRAGPGRSGHHLGQRARSGHLAGSGAVPGAARGRGPRHCRRRGSRRWCSAHDAAHARRARRAAGQRAGAQPGAGRAASKRLAGCG